MSNPRLIAYFANELIQGPNLRFPNLHVTQAIKRPQLGAHGGKVAETVPCEGLARCKRKVLAKCYGCNRTALCATYKEGLCVPCQEGEEPEGGGKRGEGRISMGLALSNVVNASIEQCGQCLLPERTTTGDLFVGGVRPGGRWLPPSQLRRLRGLQATPTSALWPKVCHGEALPWPSLIARAC